MREDVRSSGQRVPKGLRSGHPGGVAGTAGQRQGTLWRRMRTLKVGAEQSGRHPGSTFSRSINSKP